jgi:translation initiation factor IF-2
MQQFVICIVAAAMCVLCFAVGFIAAVVMRIGEHTAMLRVNGSERLPEPAAPAPQPQPRAEPQPQAQAQAQPQPVTGEVPQPPRAAPPPAAAPRPAPKPTPQPAPQPVAVAASLPFQHPNRWTDVPSPQPRPAGKVFLFGDPSDDQAAAPSFTPARPAAPQNARPMPQHSPPARLPAAEIDLLPRPQHGRNRRPR